MSTKKDTVQIDRSSKYLTQIVDIKTIKKNPSNPRIIKDDKFKKLCASLRDFPEMLSIRPIVVNGDMMVLGGNMRLSAALANGLGEAPVIVVDDLTEEQQREFVIKDNVSGGEWDWAELANSWDSAKLDEWGLDVPIMSCADSFFDDSEQESSINKIVAKIEIPPMIWLEMQDKIKNEIENVIEKYGCEIIWPK